MTHDDINRRFSTNDSPDVADKCAVIRAQCKELARDIDALCPDGREKSLALTKIEEAAMWANKAVAGAGRC